MFSLFLISAFRQLQLLLMAVTSLFDPRRRLLGRLLLLLAAPLFLVLQAVHALLWLLDEILFRGYRNVRICEPLFVIGPPRTGTTFMHHVLAADENTTTFRLWECLFGVTICGKYIGLGLARIDRSCGRLFSRLGNRLAAKFQASMDEVHPLGLNDPEEDFLLFLPTATCFLISVAFPSAAWLYSFARFDVRVNASDRALYMRYYRRCIQKHLFVFGADKRFLSKNASFAGMTRSLLDEFSDARIISTWRDPVEAVPSQLSSLRPGLEALGIREYDPKYRDELVDLMVFYYRHLAGNEDRYPDRIARISNQAMRESLQSSVEQAFAALDLPLSESLQSELEQRAEASRSHTSGHKYTLDEFGLDAELIRSRFRSEPEST